MATSLGVHSPRLDGVRALRTKDGRAAQRCFAVEGPTMLGEALAAGRRPDAVYATEAALGRLAPELLPARAPLFVVADKAMQRLSDLESAPGILAVFPQTLAALDPLLEAREPALVLAGVSDPGNAGTLLRTAEIFGVRRAIFARTAVEPYNPKVVRATMGAIFRMDVGVADADELQTAARRHGYAIVAAVRDGTPLSAVRFPPAVLVAVGSERHGVGAWLGSWDIGVTIPQPGAGESLNAAVAGGIVLYALSQQYTTGE